MAQKADLREAMLSRANPSTRTPPPSPAARAPKAAQAKTAGAARAQPQDSGGAYVQPSRAGKKPVTAFFPPGVRKQLKMMTVEHDTTIQGLMAEAFNDLFAKYGKPEIAPTSSESA